MSFKTAYISPYFGTKNGWRFDHFKKELTETSVSAVNHFFIRITQFCSVCDHTCEEQCHQVLYLLPRGHHFRNSEVYLVVGDGFLPGSPELAQLLLVLPKVCLAADQHERDAPAEVIHFRIPLWVGKQNFYIWILFCCLLPEIKTIQQSSI